MKKITTISGKTIPLAINNVDTDMIIPAQYLTNISKLGYGKGLFRHLRDQNPNFVFNQKKYADANILISQDNFACGSSREHAVWALLNAGIEAVIAESFADIFFSNSAKNGLVLIQLPANTIETMIQASQQGDYGLNIDINSSSMTSSLDETHHFELNPFHRYCFLNGLDQLDYLLDHQDKIDQWHKTQSPYLRYGEA